MSDSCDDSTKIGTLVRLSPRTMSKLREIAAGETLLAKGKGRRVSVTSLTTKVVEEFIEKRFQELVDAGVLKKDDANGA